MKTKKKGFTFMNEYIAACPEETHERLQTICAAIKKVAPEAEDKISYQIENAVKYRLAGHLHFS